LDVPVACGIECGLLGPTPTPNDIRLRITDTSTRQWASMCGGMTQVIGKALIESQLREYFRIDCAAPVVNVRLITDACVIPLTIEVSAGKAARATSHRASYLELPSSIAVPPVEWRGWPPRACGEYISVRFHALEA